MKRKAISFVALSQPWYEAQEEEKFDYRAVKKTRVGYWPFFASAASQGVLFFQPCLVALSGARDQRIRTTLTLKNGLERRGIEKV